MTHPHYAYTLKQHLSAWSVHLFTASAAFFGILSLHQIYKHQYVLAFWLMAITVFIDAVDGTFARKLNVKNIIPHVDGALLDNIVDYLSYVIAPCFFLCVNEDMLPAQLTPYIIAAISITSAYQFCQSDAKTPDHFFKGFPCYWNFAVFYMFIFNTQPYTNFIILLVLCFLIFVPIKYVYPSRIDYLTPSKKLKRLMHLCSGLFGISSIFMLSDYPHVNSIWLSISLAYIGLYLVLSIYRTFHPLETRWG